jgi:hypothetical protein
MKKVAERVGFEPTVPCGIASFQDWCLKPLGHLSVTYEVYKKLGSLSRKGKTGLGKRKCNKGYRLYSAFFSFSPIVK